MAFSVETPASSNPLADGVVEVGTSFIEEYFGVSREALRKWEANGCPKLSRGKWDFIAVLRWRGGLAPIEAESEETDKNAYLRKVKADAFLKEQQGQIAEIELQKLRGEVIEMEEVEQTLSTIILNTRNLLLALPSKVAPRLFGLSSLEALRESINGYSDDLAKVTTRKAVEKLIAQVIEDFTESKTLAEISEAVGNLIHESLEELSSVDIDQFGAEEDDKEE